MNLSILCNRQEAFLLPCFANNFTNKGGFYVRENFQQNPLLVGKKQKVCIADYGGIFGRWDIQCGAIPHNSLSRRKYIG
jgi:hypothetical protein